jgi:hypothetical protein
MPDGHTSNNSYKPLLSLLSSSNDDFKQPNFCMEKLTTTNWVSWNSQFLLYLKGHGLSTLLDNEWTEEDMKKPKYRKKNCQALTALCAAVSKELHPEILARKKSFIQAWQYLSTACGIFGKDPAGGNKLMS